MTQAIGIRKFANHSLRSTSICTLKRKGYSDRQISKLSGHKAKEFSALDSYDPSSSIEERRKIADDLMPDFDSFGKETVLVEFDSKVVVGEHSEGKVIGECVNK